MPARIVSLTGPTRGQAFPIEKDVSRIGGDPGCDLHVPGLPPVALTLRYHNGRYEVFNRSGVPLEIGGRRVTDSAPAAWQDGEELALGGGAALRMSIEGDGAPARGAPAAVESPELSREPADEEMSADTRDAGREPAVEEATTRNVSSRGMQVAVILLCIVVGGFLLLEDATQADPQAVSRANAERGFTVVTTQLAKEVSEGGPNAAAAKALQEMLYEARVAQLRGNTGTAAKQYRRARDFLLSRVRGSPSAAPKGDADAYRYVLEQLASLGV